MSSKSDIECGVKLAGHESKDRLYEPKRNRKLIRAVTVLIYVLSVSLAGIILSLYYVFFWSPAPQHQHLFNSQTTVCHGVALVVDEEGSRETPKVLPQREEDTTSAMTILDIEESSSSEIPILHQDVPD